MTANLVGGEMLWCILSILPALPQALANNEFISPKYAAAAEPGTYSGNTLWSLGSSQVVAFQTDWDEYRIELWQQALSGASASKSKTLMYNQSAGESLAQSFYWTVQTNELRLDASPVFFFWMFDNLREDSSQTSPFFNITVESSSTSSVSSVSSQTSASTTAPPTASGADETITSAGNESTDGSASSSLSAGSAAGIGVGVSVAALLAALVGFLWYRRKKGSKAMGTTQPPSHPERQEGPKQEVSSTSATEVMRPLVEIDSHRQVPAVEMAS
ncbi:hypothetical protein F5Y15DRAFT_422142 [Xylariaceae sp. FL0016]|nr:hypothetical protein F5Y15DRAFT_422142 [Xylariaceae sp. FL0016]